MDSRKQSLWPLQSGVQHLQAPICPVCSRIAARRVKMRLQQALELRTLKKWRLITLTVPTSGEPLKTSVQWLLASFKKLRKTANWRRYITGGYAVLEVTYNAKSDHWHPHLHVVAGGCFTGGESCVEIGKGSPEVPQSPTLEPSKPPKVRSITSPPTWENSLDSVPPHRWPASTNTTVPFMDRGS